MVDPFLKMKKNTTSILIRIAIGFVVVVCVAGIGFGVYKFISYQQMGGIPAGETFAQVVISSPQTGVQLEAGESLLVAVNAIGLKPYQTIELWINGELLGEQNASNGGEQPFSTYFSWMPSQAGIYSLISSGVDIDGNKVISSQVVAFVSESETGIDFSSIEYPKVFPISGGGGYEPPKGPGNGDSTGPGEVWAGSVGNWVNSLTTEGKPSVPEIVVRVGECAAEIMIHDLSDNEEGFVVYRQTGISQDWEIASTLSSQSDFEWISFIDEGIYGAVTYYVSAFNIQGESESNLVLVNIDPSNCSSDEELMSTGSLAVNLQFPNLNADWIYCYNSTDGVNWARVPHLGFLTPTGDGVQTEILALSLAGDGSEGGQITPEISLYMDCWGWSGEELEHLGRLEKEGLVPLINNNQVITGEGITAEVAFEISTLPGLGDIYPIKAGIKQIGDVQINFNQLKVLSSLNATSLEIPRVYLSQTVDPELCGEHLPPDARNFLGQLFYCFPYPIYDPNKGATDPQPYLIWDFDFFEPTCLGGVSDQCKNYWELLDLAEESGGQVGFDVLAINDWKTNNWQVTEEDLTMFVAPPLKCFGETQYSVRMWYKPGDEGSDEYASEVKKVGKYEDLVLYGPYSNVVNIPCDNTIEIDPSVIQKIEIPRQYLNITFESVQFSHLDDGDVNEWAAELQKQSVEMYGYFRVKAPSIGHWEYEQCFFPEFGNCSYEPFWAGTRRYLNAGEWEEDTYKFYVESDMYKSKFVDLDSEILCKATSKYSCKFDGQATPQEIDNNTLKVFVEDGDTITLDILLIDYDELSGDDVVCFATYSIFNKSLEEWADMDDQLFRFNSLMKTDSGDCIFEVSVDATWGY